MLPKRPFISHEQLLAHPPPAQGLIRRASQRSWFRISGDGYWWPLSGMAGPEPPSFPPFDSPLRVMSEVECGRLESSPSAAHFQRFSKWIPAFAGMTGVARGIASRMTPVLETRFGKKKAGPLRAGPGNQAVTELRSRPSADGRVRLSKQY